MSAAGLIRDFFNWNRRLGDRIETWLGTDKPDFADEYNDLCASWITEHPDITVLDVGTGKRLTYAALLGSTERWIIGCDISKEEMRYNSALDEAIVSDASVSIPLSNASIDFLTSNYCIEHLLDVDRFLAEASRVLKPNGRLCVVFAGGYSLHAIINKILPHEIGRASCRDKIII